MRSELEKQFDQINELLPHSRNILIASHENPDADAIGSILALHLLFEKQGIQNVPYLPDVPLKNLSFLPGFEAIQTDLEENSSFELAFCLDYGDFWRLKLPQNLEIQTLVTIDHHPRGSQRGSIQIIEPTYSSTSEIIYWWMKHSKAELNKDIATCLLAGILEDSGGLRHRCTSFTTLKVVSELLNLGAPLTNMQRYLLRWHDQDFKKVNLVGEILSRIKVEEKTGLAYSFATLQDIQKLGPDFNFDLLCNFISMASPINFGLFLTEKSEQEVSGSLRSEPHSGKEVEKIAKMLGGGGHPYAAGFRFHGTIEEALQKVLELV